MPDDTGKKEDAPPKVEETPPDPDEDDLDDLDDVLDQFTNTALNAKAPAPPSSGPGRPAEPRPDPAELLVEDEEEFAKELQKEMSSLLSSPEMQKQFEDLVKGLDEAGPADEDGKAEQEPKKGDENFQETIRKTMERMQTSDSSANAAAAEGPSDDFLAQMLKEMESGGFGGEGSDEDFSKILMGMMEQLTNKEILYEPMKELNDKFPDWLEKNKKETKEDDLKRYEEQAKLVKEIVGRFERNGYSDSNAEDREYIVERMQKMQAAGSPPPDLVGDMTAAQEALEGLDGGCPTQ